MKDYDVVAMGGAIVDILAKVEEKFIDAEGLQKGGMILIDEARADSLYDAFPSAQETSGGSAANTLAGMASLGAKVGFIGKVKNDQLGKIFSHDLRSIGVDYHTQPAPEGPATARCLIAITPDAERTMATFLGANTQIRSSDLDREMLGNAKILYIEGYLWDEPHAKAAIVNAIEIASNAGAKIALSLSDPFCVERHGKEFYQLIKDSVDIVFCNEDELIALTQASDFDSGFEELLPFVEVLAVTRGAAGSVIATDKEKHHIQAEAVNEVIDTTGAGDLYAAGFLYGFIKGEALQRCGVYASIAAGEIIQHIGARPQTSLSKLVIKAA